MDHNPKIQPSAIIIYAVLAAAFLFVSSETGSYLLENTDLPLNLVRFLQGVLFTVLTLVLFFFVRRKDRGIIRKIKLGGPDSPGRMKTAILIPFILISLGILSADLFGLIENTSLNLTGTVMTALLLNTVTAFLYEAFPEELFLRGLIYEQLRRKFSFPVSLFSQTVIFLFVAVSSFLLQSILFGKPVSITPDYVILIFFFGLVLQLVKEYTGTLWMSIIFHLIYLETARFISGASNTQGEGLIVYDELFPGALVIYLSFLFLVLGSLACFSILVFRLRKHNI